MNSAPLGSWGSAQITLFLSLRTGARIKSGTSISKSHSKLLHHDRSSIILTAFCSSDAALLWPFRGRPKLNQHCSSCASMRRESGLVLCDPILATSHITLVIKMDTVCTSRTCFVREWMCLTPFLFSGKGRHAYQLRNLSEYVQGRFSLTIFLWRELRL